MKTVTDAKGLTNIGTATTRRLKTKPPQRGTSHLEMYLLSKEKERLEQELDHLDKRRTRIHGRVAAVVEELSSLAEVAMREGTGRVAEAAVRPTGKPAASSPEQEGHRWNTMALEY